MDITAAISALLFLNAGFSIGVASNKTALSREALNGNLLKNPTFETDLAGWQKEGAVTYGHQSGSVVMDNGPAAIRQKHKMFGLRVLEVNAVLHSEGKPGAILRVRCFDARGHMVMDLPQPVSPDQKPTQKGLEVGIYMKSHAFTTTVEVSVEKSATSGTLSVASVELKDDSPAGKPHPPQCDLDAYMSPIWNSHVVTNETALLLSEGRSPPLANLLFVPTRIVSVRDSSLKTEFHEGSDFVISGRTLRALPRSKLPTMRDSDFEKGDYKWFNLGGRHVVVTYEHADPWSGPVPAYAGDQLPNIMERLRGRKPIKIVAFGDSITLGNNVSSVRNEPPYMPTWAELFVRRLRKAYRNSRVKLFNTALGGMTSYWGVDNAERAVGSLRPDLVIVAFGMNDFWSIDESIYRSNIAAIMDRIRASSPKAEFLLVAPMRFDPTYASDPQYLSNLLSYAGALRSLTGKGVQMLDMTAITDTLYSAKKPKDFVTDPLHPDDFLARWYAQGLAAMLIKQ